MSNQYDDTSEEPVSNYRNTAYPSSTPPPPEHKPSISIPDAEKTVAQLAREKAARSRAKMGKPKTRIRIGLGLMVSLLVVVGGKLVAVQAMDLDNMSEAALANRISTVELPAERGKILDTNGTVLADSVIRYDLTADQKVNTKTESFNQIQLVSGKPQVVEVDRITGIRQLAKLLGQDPTEMEKALTGEKAYVMLAKDIKPDLEEKITKLNIPGVFSVGTSKRVYPVGAVAGGIVGFMEEGGKGVAGLEQTQNDTMTGTNGKRTFEIGADGLRIPVGTDEFTPAKNGNDVKLTLNTDLQYFAQQAIQAQKNKFNAEWGSVIVSDIKTGNIIAMADTDAPDPNNPGSVSAENRGVRSITAAVEPGSVTKTLTLAALIEEGKASPLETLTIPSSFTINGQNFTDAFDHGTEERTIAGVLGWSMNTGTVMAGSRLTKQQRYDWMTKFGIGEKPEIGLPGEAKGILAPADQWDGRQEYTILFGQGVSQSTLQTVRAYQSIGNNGVMLQPRLIDSYISPDGTEDKVEPEASRKILSPETAKSVRDLLESAVTEGEIKEAGIPGYRVGAKTGTSQSPCDDGAGFCGYTASLIGMAPMDDPKFVVEVVLQRPKGSIYGITNGPVFRSVMSQALRTYNVAPSKGTPARLPQYAEGFVPEPYGPVG